eukprot:CAMPEP_0184382578 /NCGR_PEP_ID=MMETSP0007-20130409/6441_1 /TAXON_ID=97485 /ORGANISM="Prymnesium parvum, Strain Texoma1" /LENGTH=209 /DNA_ID=CAMNT_0026728671 /DNA_START=268 /DNA_END=896 /DNA_ORIENTATION=+
MVGGGATTSERLRNSAPRDCSRYIRLASPRVAIASFASPSGKHPVRYVIANIKDDAPSRVEKAHHHEDADQIHTKAKLNHIAHLQPARGEGHRVRGSGDGQYERERARQRDRHHQHEGMDAHRFRKAARHRHKDRRGGHVGGDGCRTRRDDQEEEHHHWLRQRTEPLEALANLIAQPRHLARVGQSEATAQQQDHPPRQRALYLRPVEQ